MSQYIDHDSASLSRPRSLPHFEEISSAQDTSRKNLAIRLGTNEVESIDLSDLSLQSSPLAISQSSSFSSDVHIREPRPLSNDSLVSSRVFSEPKSASDSSTSLFNASLLDSLDIADMSRHANESVKKSLRGLIYRENSLINDIDLDTSLHASRLLPWMLFFCTVTFDINVGQMIETIYPKENSFLVSSATLANLCFSSFPDSNTLLVDEGNVAFSFRIRNQASPASHHHAIVSHTSAPFLYGYVYFRQHRDSRQERGCTQKAVVLVSQHPFLGLFSHLMSVTGPRYFECGLSVIEVVSSHISMWPPPSEGLQIELPFFGDMLHVELPTGSFPQLSDAHYTWSLSASAENAQKTVSLPKKDDISILASVKHNSLYECFRPLIPELWLLWELMILAEPLAILASTPALCSDAVWSLIDMIKPLVYGGDYRPYFTIHDPDFRDFISPPSSLSSASSFSNLHNLSETTMSTTAHSSSRKKAVLLGVTNPVFNRSVDGWPHIVRLTDTKNHAKPAPSNLSLPSNTFQLSGSPVKTTPLAMRAGCCYTEGIVSPHRRYVSRDKKLLQQISTLENDNNDVDDVMKSDLLRNYFAMLTKNFLYPLERYFLTLIPSEKDSSYFGKQAPRIHLFQHDAFLKFLETCECKISMRSHRRQEWTDLYLRFIKSPNFTIWLLEHETHAHRQLRKKHLEMLAEASVFDWMQNKSDTELQQLITKIKTELKSDLKSLLSNDIIYKLMAHLDTLISSLPEQLRNVHREIL